MDPTATIRIITDPDATREERTAATYDLIEWVNKGGFLPALTEKEACAIIAAFYGVEDGIVSDRLANGETLIYVNRGDTYDNTLCRIEGSGKGWFWSCLGEEIERGERERFDETGEAPCCYCGEFSDDLQQHETRSWSGHACEWCRNQEIS